MKTHSNLGLVSSLAASTLLTFSSLQAAETDKPSAPDKDTLPIFENYLTLAGQGTWVSGDKAAFQAQNWTSKNGFGGIQDFRYAQDLGKDFSVKADGHALFGNADYLAHLTFAKTDLGSVDFGYKQFRTYYDGIGGFFPNNSAWFPLPDKELHVDRSKFWIETKLTLPNAPVVTLKYINETRDGTKDTTIWGDTDFTGIPSWSTSPANPDSSNRKIVANYLNLDERHENLTGTVRHTMGQTNIEASVVSDRIDNLNTRGINRYPGELKLFPRRATTSASPILPENVSDAVSGYDRQGVESDSLAFIAKAETLLSESVKIHAGITYQDASADFTAERPLATTLQTTGQGVQTIIGGFNAAVTAAPPFIAISAGRAPGAYQNLVGSSKTENLIGTLGVDLKIGRNLFIETGLKAEDRYIKASDSWVVISRSVNLTTGAITETLTPNAGKSKIKETAWTPEISLRYTGLRNISLYGNADYRYSPGTEDVTNSNTSPTTGIVTPTVTNDDTKENHGRYTLGANWTPNSLFNIRAETFLKNHKNDFLGYAASTGSSYLLASEYHGAKLTATVKPLPTLSFTTRYIYQTGTMDVTTASTMKYESMNAKTHTIGETIDWSPIKQFYLQGNLNVVFSTTSTAYPRAGLTANDVLRNADNNYITASVIAGFVIDKVTNAEVQYTHYKASNFEPLYSTQPYGAGARNYSVTAGVKRKLTDTLIADAKVGYISSRNDTTGGNTDYTARVAYVSLQQAF